MAKTLEIGPGQWKLEGADLLDSEPRDDLTYQATWGEHPLPIPDALYDDVFASHVLEHVPWMHTKAALQEVLRILKPGGKLEVWVPDFKFIVENYRQQKCGDGWRVHNPQANYMKWVNGRIFTRGPGLENFHRAVFDEEYLRWCLYDAGFAKSVRLAYKKRGRSHGDLEIGMEAFK